MSRRRRFGILVLLFCTVAFGGCHSHDNLPAVSTPLSIRSNILTAGMYHSLSVKPDGTLWAWGSNDHGQLGDNTDVDRSQPVQVGTDNDWVAVYAYENTTAAIKRNGSLWTWGGNDNGQLGDNTNVDRSQPVRVGTDNDWVAAAPGASHLGALKSDGSLWAWGSNASGQVGDNTTVDRALPVRVGTDRDWVAVSAGAFHSLALKSDGSLWAWGNNFGGRLGDNTITDRYLPVQVGSDSDWATMSGGYRNSVATKRDGTLWAWGSNSNGELGDGTKTDRHLPVNVGTDNLWRMALDGKFAMAGGIRTDNTLRMVGWNGHGQFGNSTNTDSTGVWIQVGSATDWSLIALGDGHTLGMKTDGTLYGWGFNDFGQVGDNSVVERWVPVPVAFP